jgi:hypothetical protein
LCSFSEHFRVRCVYCLWKSKPAISASTCESAVYDAKISLLESALREHGALQCTALDDPHSCDIMCPCCCSQFRTYFGNVVDCDRCAAFIAVPDVFGRPTSFASRDGRRSVPAVVIAPEFLPMPSVSGKTSRGSRFKR